MTTTHTEAPAGSSLLGPARRGVLVRHAAFLPLTPKTPPLTLLEGDTPLIPVPTLAKWVGVEELYVKYEALNPTGSFKDRGMVVAVAKAIEDGKNAIICASTGNTSASAAAYAARAGLTAVVLLPRGKVALGKIAQAIIQGARAFELDTNFDGALEVIRALAAAYPVALVNSINPFRLEGQATAAYEICDALGDAPDVLALPVGNGGNITAYWMGFRRFREAGGSTRLPKMVGVQAAGAAPLVRGEPVANPETIASAIRIGRPATWDPAIAAARDSGGTLLAVEDDGILEAYREIARREGIFCEPASAASVAGLRVAVREGKIDAASRCVCVLTGHGLKDPAHAIPKGYSIPILEPSVEAVARELGW